ncbi:hypothetical protein NQ317_009542 [Molorchus minor]|uniref:Uncharacterized protein n=1 Tax=Molorchus minor TaxID=1323400 RepID=A0ABQ9JA22_9CUCU|nr:hypothetical protein NQ317_009542 [Molorchus minor]
MGTSSYQGNPQNIADSPGEQVSIPSTSSAIPAVHTYITDHTYTNCITEDDILLEQVPIVANEMQSTTIGADIPAVHLPITCASVPASSEIYETTTPSSLSNIERRPCWSSSNKTMTPLKSGSVTPKVHTVPTKKIGETRAPFNSATK